MVPEVLTENAHRFAHRPGGCHRAHRHLGLCQEGAAPAFRHRPAGETTLDPWLDDPSPDYDTEPVVPSSRRLKRRAAPERASRAPCSAAPSPPAAFPFLFDFRAHFCHSAPMETQAFGFRLRATPRRAKSDFLSVV